MNAHLDQHGYAVLPHVLGAGAVATLLDDLGRIGPDGGHGTGAGPDAATGNGGTVERDAFSGGRPPAIAGGKADEVRFRGAGVYAVRNLLSLSAAVRELTRSPSLRELVEPILGPAAQVVRAILFDKTAGANWTVVWHQDLSIAVRGRREVPGFGPWSIKAGVPHVQPPADLLARMLTVRLHLDACGPANGPLLVLPGSHAAGALTPPDVDVWRRRVPPVPCHVPAGGAVLMRPLLLHASRAAAAPGHRRVVHLEWAADRLPAGLQWHEPEDLASHEEALCRY